MPEDPRRPQLREHPAKSVQSDLSIDWMPDLDEAAKRRHLSTSLSAWSEEVHASCNSLLDLRLSHDIPPGGPPGDSGQVSLVVSFGDTSLTSASAAESERGASHVDHVGVRVQWVHWTYPTKRLGKPVTLDDSGGIIYVPNFVKSQQHFEHVIHPAIGACMRRSKYRDHVPQPIQRLKTMCDTAFAALPIDDPSCFICGDDDAGALPPDVRCMFCLLHSHRKCCNTLMDYLQAMTTNGSFKTKYDPRKLKVSNFSLDMVPPILFAQSGIPTQSNQAGSNLQRPIVWSLSCLNRT